MSQFVEQPFEMEDYREIAVETDRGKSVHPLYRPGTQQHFFARCSRWSPNQAALGLNYRMNTAQWPAIQQAMVTRDVVIAGPLELVQGGRALLIRIPIFPASFLGQPLKERSYWGVATLVLDEEGMMKTAGITDVINGIRIGLVNRSAVASNNMIFGSQSLLEKDHVSLPLHLPGRSELGACRSSGGGLVEHGQPGLDHATRRQS